MTTPVSISVVTATSNTMVISTHATTLIPSTTVAGTLTTVSLSQVSNVANTATTYTFAFTLANKIPANGWIVIENTPGLTFAFDGTIGCGVASGSLNACAFNSVNAVEVQVNTEISKLVSVTIIIGNYTNPPIPTSTSFTVKTYSDSAKTYLVDSIASGLVPTLECDYP